MKNYKTLKVLGIIILVVLTLTWLIPGTSLSSSVLELGEISATGIADFFSTFDILAMYFAQNSLVVLMVGALYAVANKTGAYKVLVEKIATIFKKKKWLAILTTILFYALIPALTNIYFAMFMFIPLSISVLIELGYNKRTALISTVGSILVGLSGALFYSDFMSYATSTDNVYVWIKLGYLVLSIAGLTVYTVLMSKNKIKDKDTDEDVLIVPDKRDSKNKRNPKAIGISIVFGLMLIFMILGLTSWSGDAFSTFNTSVLDYSIGSFKIFGSIFGAFSAFGAWSYTELYCLIALATITLGICYKLTLKEFFDAFFDGMHKFFGLAMVIFFINVVVIFTLNSGFLATILNLLAKTGNNALVTMASLIGSPFVVDPIYVIQYNMGVISAASTSVDGALLGLISQTMYGMSMLLVPTSVIVIAGLLYTRESYKNWFKHIWKIALILILLAFIAITIASVM